MFKGKNKNNKVLLCIFDGFGFSKIVKNNAIANAKTPHLNKILQNYPHSLLKTNGRAVGLPDNQMGNSEVGHSTIGSGRVTKQIISTVNDSIKDGSILKKNEIITLLDNNTADTIHLIGLYSNGGVHSSINHLHALIKALSGKKISLHLFSDGRDVPPNSFKDDINALQSACFGCNVSLATICGRYYGMDRDKRHERTELAFNAIFYGKGDNVSVTSANSILTPNNSQSLGRKFCADIISAIRNKVNAFYNSGTTDEFIKPIIINGFKGVQQFDDVVFFNFRADRMRQIVDMFLKAKHCHGVFNDVNKSNFDNGNICNTFISKPYFKGNIVCMVNYFADNNNGDNFLPNSSSFSDNNPDSVCNISNRSDLKILFNSKFIPDSLGELIANAGMKQLRIAETEKYAHVTYFFNCGRETPFNNEDRIMISSPKVATYDLQPCMSATKLCDKLISNINLDSYDLIVANFANCDMVGHTGNFRAAVKAVECLDEILGRLVDTVKSCEYEMILTADHGNVEEMVDLNSTIHTQHTLNPVYFIGIGSFLQKCYLKDGSLCDVAPTILELLFDWLTICCTYRRLYLRY
ncbi:MAG: 2,3-bisphosphoglycerate-independent phosphoglycerate mutase [Alphaproteobacteria bacterium]|nr:2,3-bisphosphoglycerate-independent phosphoglycerate mutase [Rickettsiales bacterium]